MMSLQVGERLLLALVLYCVSASPAHSHMLSMLGKPPTPAQLCHALQETQARIPESCADVALLEGEGTIQGSHEQAGTVTIEHEAIEGLGGAGSHRYTADPPIMLRLVQAGDRVSFVVDGTSLDVIDLRLKGPRKRLQDRSADAPVTDATAETSGPGEGRSGSAQLPSRAAFSRSRAFVEQPHTVVADACKKPRGRRRIEFRAGRQHALAEEAFGFSPSLVQVQPCEEIELVLFNDDSVRHTFMLPGLNPMASLEVAGGESASTTFTTPAKSITLTFHCHVPRHEKHGMRGWIVVGHGGIAGDQDEQGKGSKVDRFVQATGTILSRNARRSTVVIAHDEIPGYMAPMTKIFTLADPNLMTQLQENQRIRFTVDTVDGRLLAADLLLPESDAGTSQADVTDSDKFAYERLAPRDTVTGVGTVVAVISGGRQVVIDHDEISGFMAPMTMAFALESPVLVRDLSPGDRVRFEIRRADKVVVSIEPLGTAPSGAASAITQPAPPDPRVAPSAVRLGRDLDGDGDPDEVHFLLEVVEIEEEIYPGEVLNTWVFAPPGVGMLSSARLPSPVLRVEQGDRVTVTLSNTHYFPHTIHLHGVLHDNAMDGVPEVTQAAVMPGEAFDYTFVARNPGSHIYHCHVQPDVHVPMGLIGLLTIEENRPDNHFTHLVVGAGEMPDMSRAVAEQYDREYALVYMDMDERLNRIPVEELLPSVISRRMHREYDSTRRVSGTFMVNGRAFPLTLRDSLIKVKSDQRIKLRMLNAGGRSVHIHTHGHKGEITHLDGNRVAESARQLRDVYSIGPAQRVDVKLRTGKDDVYASGPGVWMIHDHSPEAVTNRGINPGGNLTAMAYEAHIREDGMPLVAGSLEKYFDPAYYRGEVPVFGGSMFAPATKGPAEAGGGDLAIARSRSIWANGRVVSVRVSTRKLLINHQAIDGLRPAMLLAYRLARDVDVESIKSGMRIRFALDPIENVITALESLDM